MLLDTKRVLSSVGGRGQYQGTRYFGTLIPHIGGKLICSEFNNVFEKPCISPEKAIKHEIDLLPDSVPPAKR